MALITEELHGDRACRNMNASASVQKRVGEVIVPMSSLVRVLQTVLTWWGGPNPVLALKGPRYVYMCVCVA